MLLLSKLKGLHARKALNMDDKDKAQKYINNFRREISKYLKKDIGISSSVHLSKIGGAVLEFEIGDGLKNNDSYKGTSKTIGNALKNIEQKTFKGNLNAFSFSGTNIILEPKKIIFIKSDEDSEWDETSATKDINRLLVGGGVK